ncbi:hypothetical protein F5884DRAFT_83295 [Xylogone sp. PMI_703]|nr:hypothetical protein F5884DRAFT_83295 [Xylogone sp. PMI_703]
MLINTSKGKTGKKCWTVGLSREAPGIWVLDEPQYNYWQGSIISSLLWLSGELGTGKTVLISTIIEHIRTLYGYGNQGTVAYFYCSGTVGLDAETILRNIVRQLAESERGLDMLTNEWKKRGCGRDILKSTETRNLLCELITLNGKSQTTIIIDALDEVNLDKDFVIKPTRDTNQ